MLQVEKRAKRKISETETLSLPKLVLPFDLRQKSRLKVTLDNGVEATLFLPRGTVLRDGDLLEAEDRTLIRVVAAPETVLYVTANKPCDLMRAAYHLGNRHVPVELAEGYLKLAADPVLQEMLTQLGLTLREDCLPFQPEPGAYGGGHRHGHDSTFVEEYARAQQLFHEYHDQEHADDKGNQALHPHDDSHCHEHS
jgi:urease accessory protein